MLFRSPLAGIDLAAIAAQTTDWNGADLALLSNQAALEAIREYRASGADDPSQIHIQPQHFQAAFEALQRQKQVNG